jgi:hypothetical protein
MKQVSYIATNQQVPQAITSWFEAQNYSLQALSTNNETGVGQLSNTNILLLFVPFFHNNVYISIENVWKKYLELNYPNILLLTAGYIKHAHANYLDLLQLPENLEYFIKHAKSVSEFESMPFSGGLKIENKLQKFYEGHGDESLTDELGKVYRMVTMATDEVKVHQSPYEEVFEDLFQANHIVEKWGVLINRWHNYLPFFDGLPFFDTFKEVDAILKQIAPFFEQECKVESQLIDLNVKEKLHSIKQKLEIIGRQYA